MNEDMSRRRHHRHDVRAAEGRTPEAEAAFGLALDGYARLVAELPARAEYREIEDSFVRHGVTATRSWETEAPACRR